MSIVPQLPTPPLPALHGRRWPARLYPGNLSQCSRVRDDLRRDVASAWGTYPVVPFPFCADLGTAVWAQFDLAEEAR